MDRERQAEMSDLDNSETLEAHSCKPRVFRDWFGWFGILIWTYLMINDYRWYSNYSEDDRFYTVLIFMLLFSISILSFGFRFGRNPNDIGKIARYTTPIAIVLTATFSFMPEPLHAVAYAISPFFITPALIRSVYGVVKNARPGYTMVTYMSGLATAYFLQYMFYHFEDYFVDVLLVDPPSKQLFIVYAVILIPIWLSVGRKPPSIDPPNQSASPEQNKAEFGISKKLIFGIIAAIVLIAWVRQMCDYTNYAVEQFDDILFIPLYYIMPFFAYVALGLVADKQREKSVILIGFALYLIAIMIALLVPAPGVERNVAVIPLLFMNRFINLTIDYIAYAIPVFFFLFTKRPLFAASAGLAAYLLCRSGSVIIGRALPDMFENAGAPLFVSSAIAVVIFLVLLNYIFDRHKEKSLAAALSSALLSNANGEAQNETKENLQQNILGTGLTLKEAEIASLIINGETRRGIERKMHLTAAEFSLHEQSIKDKILPDGDPDPHISAVVKEYKLTKRETEILKFLRDGVTTNAIAEELVIAEETVRSHVRSLLMKLGLKSRADVPEWFENRMH